MAVVGGREERVREGSETKVVEAEAEAEKPRVKVCLLTYYFYKNAMYRLDY